MQKVNNIRLTSMITDTDRNAYRNTKVMHTPNLYYDTGV